MEGIQRGWEGKGDSLPGTVFC